jgi:hypothetical protein
MQTLQEFHLATADLATRGPQLLVSPDFSLIAVRGRTGVELCCNECRSASEGVLCLLAVYFLLDFNYPCAYGQFLGLFEELVFERTFASKSKKLTASTAAFNNV